MNWNLVPLAAAAPQAWRNGGGVTRELLAWPAAAHWQLRLSVADVQAAGPFSRFDGIERWFAVLEGDGVVLRIAGQSHTVRAGDAPLRFDGGAAVDCALLAGPTRDFNLMAPPGRARMQRVKREAQCVAGAASLVAVYAHAHPARLACHDGSFEVPPAHLAWRLQDTPATITVTAQDALWMEAGR